MIRINANFYTNATNLIGMVMNVKTQKNIIYPELSYRLVGLLYKTHNKLGRYRSEKQYSDYFEELLKKENIQFQREEAIESSFKGERKRRNIPDFIIEDKIIVDLKAKRLITKDDYYQMQRYLSSSNKRLGIVVNFRCQSIKPKRVINPIYDTN